MLIKKCWNWWGTFSREGEVMAVWFGSTIVCFIVGSILAVMFRIAGDSVNSAWVVFLAIFGIPSVLIFVSSLFAGLFDLVRGCFRGVRRIITGLSVWSQSNDKLYSGIIDESRFEVEYRPETAEIGGIDPLSAVKEFLSDQRQKPLSSNELITIHGSKCDGEHMTVLFTLSKASSKAAGGVKKDEFHSVTIEVRFHFIPVTRSLHINGAVGIPLEKFAQSESSLDVIEGLKKLRLSFIDPTKLVGQTTASGMSPPKAQNKNLVATES